MLRCLLLLSIVVACVSCQRGEQDAAPPDETSAVPSSAAVSGKDAYDQACAGCHEEGKDGAPRTGDADAWLGRSSLWEAVLFEHAQDGYLEMPAHGMDGTFSDEEIAAAAEYMLELTHPERPPD